MSSPDIFEEGKEALKASVEGKFKALSPKEVTELREVNLFTEDEIRYMRDRLTEAGVKLDLSKEELESLFSIQFRARPDKLDFSEGRGSGVVAALGEEKASSFVNWSYETAINYGWRGVRIEGKDNTQGRGIQQAAADILSIVASNQENQARHLQRLRQRAWVGQRRAHVFSDSEVVAAIDSAFSDVPKPQKPKEFASLPPGTLLPLWKFLTSGQK